MRDFCSVSRLDPEFLCGGNPPARLVMSSAARWRLGLLCGLAVILGAALLWWLNGGQSSIDGVYRFDSVRGPLGKTALAEMRPAADGDFRQGGTTRLAILLTDPDSAWLGLVHGLKTIGIPFRITRDYQDALRHRVVLVYPTISGRVLSRDALIALARFPEQGGTLIAVNVEGGGLEPVFGFARTVPSRARAQITLDSASPLTRNLDHERERVFRFSNPKLADQTVGSLGYADTATPPLARFEDGTAAITARQIGTGHAYALGIDLGFLLLKGYNNREEGIARAYANEFEPALDVLLRLVMNIYRAGEPAAMTLHTVPQGRRLAVVISHDIDGTAAVSNALRYAEFERGAGIRATYFVQTKYVRDWNDDVFFNQRGVAELAKLQALGAEIASHSVSHSRMFNRFALGTGQERYPEYRPFVQDREHTAGGSILGELRVSRFLLERLLPNLHIASFRPGHLENPYELPEALEAAGYRYSSSVTANNSLTHLPFRLTYKRGTAAQSAIYEFPVTIEDEAQPPLATRLPAALVLADSLARYGALMMVLIHPDVVEPKLGFERELVAALRDRAWFGALEDFGAFWIARDRVELDVETAGRQLKLKLRAPQSLRGLTINPPAGYRLVSIPAEVGVREVDGRLVIDVLEGEKSLMFVRTGARR